MKEIPVSSRCKEILEKREHMLIGISPLNSYYSEEKITELIYWGHTSFKDFHILTADTLFQNNFLAMGYSLDKAQKKTKHNWKRLYNKIVRVFLKLNISKEIYEKKIITLSGRLPENHVYDEIYSACLERYNQDPIFKQECLIACKDFLVNYTDIISDAVLENALKYLLGELPFYLDTPKMLRVNSSLIAYHKAVPFFVDLYKDRKKNFVANNQGHLILE